MMAGESQQILKSKTGQNTDTKLTDFRIVKVIDKGSFGKVFLVLNTKNDKLYAMKRINKDILIDKKQI